MLNALLEHWLLPRPSPPFGCQCTWRHLCCTLAWMMSPTVQRPCRHHHRDLVSSDQWPQCRRQTPPGDDDADRHKQRHVFFLSLESHLNACLLVIDCVHGILGFHECMIFLWCIDWRTHVASRLGCRLRYLDPGRSITTARYPGT